MVIRVNKERVPASDKKAICDYFLMILPAVTNDIINILKKQS